MSSLLDRFDAADIFAAASIDAIFVEDTRSQMQSHIALDVMIESIDQRFTESIAGDSCATLRQFLERTLARMPPTLNGVHFTAMIACDDTPVRCEKQSIEGTLSVSPVFCFRIRSYYAARQVVAMFKRRFDTRPPTERLYLLRADSRQTQRCVCRCGRSDFCRLVELAGPPNLHPDSFSALIDSRLGFCFVRCVVF